MKILTKLLIGEYESFSDEKEYKIFFTANLFLLAGILVHLFYIGVFVYLGVGPMIYVELASIAALSAAVYVNHRRIKRVPALILCIEIGVNGVLWAIVLTSGDNHYLYTFVALLAVFLFLEIRMSQKVFIILFLMVCINIAHSFKNNGGIYITDDNMEWLSFLSLNMVVLLLIAELSINEIVNQAVREMHKKTVSRLANEMMHDPLTQLCNRRYFQKNEDDFNCRLSERDCCVAMLDVDYFKKINDTYGHDVGDAVLVFFAAKMKCEFGASAEIMRWGGEEFVIFFREASLAGAYRKLYKFKSTIKRSVVRHDALTVKFTFTAGLAKAGCGMTVSEAITQADKYLYHGKESGRDRICYR